MNPKNLILSQVKEMLEKNNIPDVMEIYFTIDLLKDKTEAILLSTKFEKQKFNDIALDRKNILVKVFLNKAEKYCKSNNIIPEGYIIKIQLIKEELFFYVIINGGDLIIINVF